jgi:hypothetical protein
MNFAAIVGSSLRSGYALPAKRPDNGLLRNQPAGDPFIEGETLSRPSRPPLYDWSGVLRGERRRDNLRPLTAILLTSGPDALRRFPASDHAGRLTTTEFDPKRSCTSARTAWQSHHCFTVEQCLSPTKQSVSRPLLPVAGHARGQHVTLTFDMHVYVVFVLSVALLTADALPSIWTVTPRAVCGV